MGKSGSTSTSPKDGNLGGNINNYSLSNSSCGFGSAKPSTEQGSPNPYSLSNIGKAPAK